MWLEIRSSNLFFLILLSEELIVIPFYTIENPHLIPLNNNNTLSNNCERCNLERVPCYPLLSCNATHPKPKLVSKIRTIVPSTTARLQLGGVGRTILVPEHRWCVSRFVGTGRSESSRVEGGGPGQGSPFLDPPRVSGEGARKAPQVCRRPPWIGSPHSSLARLPSLEGGGRGGGRSFAGSEIEAHPWFREGGRRNACCSCAARVLSLCCDLHARGGCFCGWMLSRYFGDGIGKLGWWSMDDGGNFLFFTFSFFFGKVELFTLWIERSIYFLFVLC